MKGTHIFMSIFVGLVACAPLAADAAELRFGERTSTGPNEEIINDAYLTGGMVDSAAPITGDLLVGGGSVSIGSDTSEDATIAGGNININGDTGDDVRVVGGNITIGGSVGGDVAVLGGQTHLSGEGIGGDVLWAGGTLSVNTPVSGSMRLFGGEVYINSPISGDVNFDGGKLILGNNAVIEGNLTYRAPQELEMQEGATVNGDISYMASAKGDVEDKKGLLAGLISIALLITFFMRFAGAMVLGLGLRGYAQELVNTALGKPLAMIGLGFLSLIAIPIAGILLLATVVGVPLGILTLVAYLALLIFVAIMAPVLLGCFVHKRFTKEDSYIVSWKTILLGVVLYMILGLIPFVGWAIQGIIALATIGATIKIKWATVQKYIGK